MQKKNAVKFSSEIYMVLTNEDHVYVTKNSDRKIYMKKETVINNEQYKHKNIAIYRLEDIVSYEELKEVLENEEDNKEEN